MCDFKNFKNCVVPDFCCIATFFIVNEDTFMAKPQRAFWPPWWAVLIVAWLAKPERHFNMVRISSATHGADDSLSLLKGDAAKKIILKVKRNEEKDFSVGAAREIRERFPDFTFVDAYVRKIGNFNLFEEIIDAKEQAKKHNSRLSTSFWSNLRMKWQKINSAESLLVVANQAEEVPKQLLLALQTCTSTNTRTRTSVPLVS